MGLWPRVRGAARTGGLVLAAFLAALAVFDVLAYFLMPASLTTFAPDYRQAPQTLRDMRGYHRADPVLGFDIAPNQPGHHRRLIRGVGKVPAASNDLGCRDPRNLSELRRLGRDYIYFAGDSFTWSFTRASHSFPRAYERASGNPSLNCGVEATGQWHQLEKFRRTARAIGHLPRLVVVGLFANDREDSLLYPQFTVIGGDRLANDVPLRRTQALGLALAGKGPAAQGYANWFWRPADLELAFEAMQRHGEHPWHRAFLEQYSLSHHIRILGRVRRSPLVRFRMELAREGYQNYLQNPYTRPHREALRAWAHHARQHGYRLAVVLIPGKRFFVTRGSWGGGIRAHLASLGVPLLDFAEHALTQGLRKQDLYWQHDIHLSENGNRVLGEWLAEQLP